MDWRFTSKRTRDGAVRILEESVQTSDGTDWPRDEAFKAWDGFVGAWDEAFLGRLGAGSLVRGITQTRLVVKMRH
ncbi:MAG: hypothetical protein JWO30_4565 [Fibrobacteres bacterium]|nr:hypothetical protein [Fibrobacterota bacterium]